MKKKILSHLDWFLGIGLLGYGIFLFTTYLSAYPSYGLGLDLLSAFSQNIQTIWFPFLLLLTVLLGSMIWQNRYLSLFRLTIYLWIGFVFFLLLVGLLQKENIFEGVALLSISLRMLATTGLILFGAIIFTIFLIVLGKGLIRFFYPRKTITSSWHSIISQIHHGKSSDFMTSDMRYWVYFFIGFMSVSFLVFFLSKLNILWLPVLVTFFVFILIYFWKDFVAQLNTFFTRKIRLSFWQIIVVVLVLSVTILNLSQSFFPFSLGWDTSNHYLLTTKILMETGALRMGIFPAFEEMVLSFFGMFTGLSGVQFLIVFWGSFLPLSFYMLGKRFKLNESLLLLLTLSLFLIPAIQFQFSKDLKLDIIFLQLMIVVLAYFPSKKAMLLLGFAPLAKLTAFGFFPVAILSLFFASSGKAKNKSTFERSNFVIKLGLLLLPFSIYAGMNLWSHGHIPNSLGQWQEVLLKGENPQPVVNIPRLISAQPNWVASTDRVSTEKKENYVSTSFQEEVGRYSGFETNLFKKIWAVFVSPNIPAKNKQYVDLGFIWVLFLPLVVLGFCTAFKKRSQWLLFYFLAIVFLLLWLFLLGGVAWYGFPFIILVFLLGGEFMNSVRFSGGILRLALFISILLGFWGLGVHTSNSSITTTISWASFPTSENGGRLSKTYFDEPRSVANLLNKDPNAVIFRVGTFAKFWIDQPDRRVIEDPQLDIWGRIAHGRSDEAMLRILRTNQIKYLLIDRGTISIETNKSGTLHQKFAQLDAFIQKMSDQKHLKILFWGKSIILLELSM